jgi:hypothetical protein
MCCTGSGSNCNCGCETIVLPTPVGPAGATGPAGTTILYWNNSSLSTATTGSDVLLLTTTLVADTLDTNGDTLEIEIVGSMSNNAVRYLKLEFNNPITTVLQSSGVLANGVFKTTVTITRRSNISAAMDSLSHWNSGASSQFLSSSGGAAYVTDYTTTQNIKLYVNQDVASSLTVNSFKIKKAEL